MENGRKNKLNIILTVLFGVAVFFFIITFSIGLPIYCRFFYYLQINPLEIPERTGRSYAEIKTAYDQVLNYLTFFWCEFKTGVFKYSAEGADHFKDCRKLFNLNAIVLVITAAIIVVSLILNKKKKIKLLRPFGLTAGFFSAVSVFVIGGILGVLVSLDFDRAFVVFHHIFFPGKDNWMFNPYKDEIINALPEQFFLNCAIFIGAGVVLISLFIIIRAIILKKREKTTKID